MLLSVFDLLSPGSLLSLRSLAWIDFFFLLISRSTLKASPLVSDSASFEALLSPHAPALSGFSSSAVGISCLGLILFVLDYALTGFIPPLQSFVRPEVLLFVISFTHPDLLILPRGFGHLEPPLSTPSSTCLGFFAPALDFAVFDFTIFLQSFLQVDAFALVVDSACFESTSSLRSWA